MAKLSLFPKESMVFALFDQQAENLVKMAQQLKDMIYIWQNVKERARLLTDMEQDGDAITHDISKLLYQSFITPMDREDISALACSMDDIADRIDAVGDTMYLYAIKSPTDRSKELADIILKETLEVQAGIAGIKGTIHQADLLTRCVNIHQVENAGDIVYRMALSELFTQPNEMAEIVKWREIYKKLASTLNGCEVFADILEGIAIKYA
jgi:uncharacterized protein